MRKNNKLAFAIGMVLAGALVGVAEGSMTESQIEAKIRDLDARLAEVDRLKSELETIKASQQKMKRDMEEAKVAAAKAERARSKPMTAKAAPADVKPSDPPIGNALSKELAQPRDYAAEDIVIMQERIEEAYSQSKEAKTLQFFGYGRAGVLINENYQGGKIFQTTALGPNNKHFRLGNEEDQFIEFGFRKFFEHGDAWSKWQIRPTYYNVTHNKLGNLADDLQERGADGAAFSERFALSEAYAQLGGTDVIAPDVKYWAGRRYYSRDNLHIMNFYWRHFAGTGGGIEDVKLGPGKLSLAFLALDEGTYQSQYTGLGTAGTKSNVMSNTWHLMYKMPTEDWGSFRFEGAYSSQKDIEDVEPFKAGCGADPELDPPRDNICADNGWQLGITNMRDDFYGFGKGITVTALQYGEDAGANLGMAFEYLDFNRTLTTDAKAFRFVNTGVGDLSPRWNIMTALTYENRKAWTNLDNDTDWWSIGARPVYAVTKNLALQFEAGVQLFKDSEITNGRGNIWKFTIAPTIKLDAKSFFGRPEVRAFATYARWDDDMQLIGEARGLDYITYGTRERRGWNFGLQAEVWFDYD